MGLVRRSLPLAAGAVMLALLLQHLGWSAVGDAVVAVGPWFLVVAAIDVLGMACDAAAIQSFARPYAVISFQRAFVAQATGYAVNRVTPGNALGEPVKVAILAADAPRPAAVSAIVLYNLATLGVAVVAIAVVAPFALLAIDLPPALEAVVWVAIGVLVVALAGVVVVLRRGLFATAIAAARLGRLITAERADRWLCRTREIDRQLRRFGDPASRRGLAFVAASRVLDWLGTLLLLDALGLGGPLVLGIMSIGILISWLANLMPLGLGIADGGLCTLFRALGASAEAGLAFAMIDRARGCLLGAVGGAVGAVGTLHRRAGREVTASG